MYDVGVYREEGFCVVCFVFRNKEVCKKAKAWLIGGNVRGCVLIIKIVNARFIKMLIRFMTTLKLLFNI